MTDSDLAIWIIGFAILAIACALKPEKDLLVNSRSRALRELLDKWEGK